MKLLALVVSEIFQKSHFVTAAVEVAAEADIDASVKRKRIHVSLKNKVMSFRTKIKLHNLQIHVLSILLYGCESWTLTADLERSI